VDARSLERLTKGALPSPCFVLDEDRLLANAALLQNVQERSGAKILLALKGFAMWSVFPLLSRAGGSGPLWGCCASSPHEARLAREEFGGEIHAFAAAFSDEDMGDILRHADHVVFNSFAQWRHFRNRVQGCGRPVACGIRVNPEHSEDAVAMYNPCTPGSRLGVRRKHFEPDGLDGLSGLHFHTLCEQGADALERTLNAFEKNFGVFLHGMQWVNFGGGHHITRKGYDVDLLCACIERIRARYNVQVYLEPGEAVALDAGWFVSTVLDVVEADMPVAVLDSSAACHMPDVLEMPYRPHVVGSGLPGEKAHGYRLAGKSCLAGDVIGEYSFSAPLGRGDRLIFTDMAHYSMVKTTTFNGLALPAILRYRAARNELELVRAFGYEEYKGRLS
jgi:carboxynorspermidine decarboxylase